ncbi:hypothetical protein QBC46DRAFT_355966 [Diplogelasinospora grovesii]|uniref:Efficient mitochondria targeting-associated protein 19 n=1 Tax=Diplogelasinospora grovesii TaxID=303347 RepID=A0AAN6N4L6_9PEZI|nr:hypothetical protein QBC46DRAFT_355966 [Diplogelasinospora grovesii]
MAVSKQSWKDYVWLVWFLIQIPVIFLVDATHFYPKWLYASPESPLHFMQLIKDNYISTYNDPIAQWTAETATQHSSWIPLFLSIEMLFSAPIVLYAVYRLGVKRAGTTGANELLFLVYAFETAFTTLVCIHDVLYWDDAVYNIDLKRTFVFNLFGPWFVIPAIMFVDMCSRILSRINAADAVAVGKKMQ